MDFLPFSSHPPAPTTLTLTCRLLHLAVINFFVGRSTPHPDSTSSRCTSDTSPTRSTGTSGGICGGTRRLRSAPSLRGTGECGCGRIAAPSREEDSVLPGNDGWNGCDRGKRGFGNRKVGDGHAKQRGRGWYLRCWRDRLESPFAVPRQRCIRMPASATSYLCRPCSSKPSAPGSCG